MSSELDLRDVHQFHQPDRSFVEALERRLGAILAGDLTAGHLAGHGGDDVDLEVSVVALPRPRRSVVLLALGATAAVVSVAVLGVVSWRLEGSGNVRSTEDRPTSPATSVATPMVPPLGPFVGAWVSTDTDGSPQTMEIVRSSDHHAIVVRDSVASAACSGAPSTTTGSGQLESDGTLVIAEPALTCDDGSTPAIGRPPQSMLANATFVHHPEQDEIVDGFGVVWRRAAVAVTTTMPAVSAPIVSEPPPTVSEDTPSEAGRPTSGGMWPQSSLEDVREAQELADAGDARYTWQLDPELVGVLQPTDETEIVVRFLQEELRWDGFRFHPIPEDGFGLGRSTNNAYIRCAPGETNPLYPSETCAPTIDEVRYERVSLDLEQLDRPGDPTGIWVVSRWALLPPFEQVVPPSEAEVAAVLETFLQARIDGGGAGDTVDVVDEYHPTGSTVEEVPLLYATTAGAGYERFEFEVVDGPVWPDASRRVNVRLFTAGDRTVVEQIFYVIGGAGRAVLEYRLNSEDVAPTTENGQPVP